MKRSLCIVPILWLAACDSCTSEPPRPSHAERSRHLLEGPPPDVARPTAIYRAAYDEARKRLNEENAASRLDEIERELEAASGGEDAVSE